MDSKTATERLREMLDARGVKHYDGTESTYWGATVLARRDGSNPVYRFSAHEVVDGLSVHLLRVTPEQAIAATLGAHSKPQSKTGDALSEDCGSLSDATLGSGECEFELNTDMTAIRCNKCGYELPAGTNLDTTRYCGGCGKAVKR